ncbi:bifunctional DNA primase/polymerase [Streptomyces sp. SID3343]|uniref:bifunctional DNA primase/polymerase n=1 Tax=Streptomyces sp. SID3343 TaxID=2690260 RepID=UPI001370EFCE|nr:bifunctional DNA primase/polymerase [Streptomyces sp. SID3343]MYW04571.1 DNA primase [Streptomyces sp. SID3343]
MSRPNLNPLKATALVLAERGWHVFPLAPGGKKPVVAKWPERATTDAERIGRCWDHGPYNIGVATGPSGLLVVDLDKPKSADDSAPDEWAEQGAADGADVFYLLADKARQPYPGDTYTVRTASGGQHLYFRAPESVELRNTAGRIGWKVDTRGNGGYVVAAGSVIGEQAYTAVVDNEPAPLPSWLTGLLRPAPLPPQEPVQIAIPNDRHSAYLEAAVSGQVDRILNSASDRHNIAVYLSAVALGQLVAGGELSEVDVTNRLMSAALQVGQGDREAQRTIRSGLAAGKGRPRVVAA